MMLIMLLTKRNMVAKDNHVLQIILRTGIIVTFIGALIFMLVNYHNFGPGTWALAVGIIILLVGILYFLFKPNKDKQN